MGLNTERLKLFNKARTYRTNRRDVAQEVCRNQVTKGLISDVKKLIPEAGACQSPL